MGGERIEPVDESGLRRPPINLFAPIEIAERAGDGDGPDRGTSGVRSCPGEIEQGTFDFAALMIDPRLVAELR
ncbi:MAG: hypothetical protein JWL62_1646, partial [Hyphomicrobiales bacterium]|nr:hypothetical protein [Hyphomicrobiales bacterium]